MKMLAFSVRDHQVGAFAQPFFLPTEGAAIRAFGDEVQKVGERNHMAQHPGDYALFLIGAFDDEAGVFVAYESPKQIATASQFAKEFAKGVH